MTVTIQYSDLYYCEGYGVDTREKARDIAASLATEPISGIVLHEPQPVTREDFQRVHSPEYTRGIFTGAPERAAQNNGIGEWSRDLSVSVQYSTGGIVEATREAMRTRMNTGSLSSGLHHAKRDHGSGFCTANGLVIAASVVLFEGAKRVLIIDFDAHCGGGTASLIKGVDGIEQIDVSVSAFDTYKATPQAQLTMSTGATYLADIRTALDSVINPESIDVVIYNAGMDPHEDCSTGGAKGITSFDLYQREKMVFHWAAVNKIPVAFALAGGYSGSRLSRSELVELHRLTIQAAVNFNEWNQ